MDWTWGSMSPGAKLILALLWLIPILGLLVTLTLKHRS